MNHPWGGGSRDHTQTHRPHLCHSRGPGSRGSSGRSQRCSPRCHSSCWDSYPPTLAGKREGELKRGLLYPTEDPGKPGPIHSSSSGPVTERNRQLKIICYFYSWCISIDAKRCVLENICLNHVFIYQICIYECIRNSAANSTGKTVFTVSSTALWRPGDWVSLVVLFTLPLLYIFLIMGRYSSHLFFFHKATGHLQTGPLPSQVFPLLVRCPLWPTRANTTAWRLASRFFSRSPPRFHHHSAV